MGIVVLGIIILVAAFVAAKSRDRRVEQFTKAGKALGLIVILLGALSAGIVQIDAGHVGVQKLFGKVQDKVLYSGLHLVNPLVEIIEVDVRTANYTMSGTHAEGKQQGDDAIRALTADGLEVIIDLTLLYKVTSADAPNLINTIGVDYEDKIVRPIARTKIRDNAVYYDAVSLYSTKRDEFQARIYDSIESEFRKRGLIIENLLIRNITLPASVKTTIEQKINAEQDAQKMQFVLQKEKQEAERMRIQAQGIADYQRIISSNLTDKQLQYEQIKAIRDLAASNNAKIVMIGGGKGSPIILDAK